MIYETRFSEQGPSEQVLLEIVDKYLKHPSIKLVTKVTHLTTGQGIFISHTDGRISLPFPVGPGKKVMKEHQDTLVKNLELK